MRRDPCRCVAGRPAVPNDAAGGGGAAAAAGMGSGCARDPAGVPGARESTPELDTLNRTHALPCPCSLHQELERQEAAAATVAAAAAAENRPVAADPANQTPVPAAKAAADEGPAAAVTWRPTEAQLAQVRRPACNNHRQLPEDPTADCTPPWPVPIPAACGQGASNQPEQLAAAPAERGRSVSQPWVLPYCLRRQSHCNMLTPPVACRHQKAPGSASANEA